MKFDAVTPYDCTYPREVTSKDIGHNDQHITVLKLKADVESEREAKHDIASPIESRSYEQTDPAQYVNNPFVEFEDSIKTYQNQFDYAKASYIGKIDLTTKVTESCAGNSVTETELPETIDGACHTVKDICIDDGTQSVEKVLVENIDQKHLYRVNDSLSTVNFCVTKGMVDDIDPISYGLISSSINENPVRGSSGSTLLHEDKSTSVAPTEEIGEKQLLPLQEFVTETWEVDSSSFNNIKDQKQSTATQQMDKGTLEEGNSTTKIVPSAVEEAIQSIGTKESPIGEVGVIKLHFDSGVATSDTEESKENTNQEPGLGEKIPKSEEAALDGATAPARSSFVHGHADLNLHGPAALSDPIVSSGYIPYSGNISHRSDSSTTSARSFAFPSLQPEWNCSPVRMAKADRRLKKHRGWRTGILCCRF